MDGATSHARKQGGWQLEFGSPSCSSMIQLSIHFVIFVGPTRRFAGISSNPKMYRQR